jgi:hypothetical protein
MATRARTKQAQVPSDAPPGGSELVGEAALAEFDRQARRHLQMSGAEFLRRWDAREFPDTEDPDVGWVASLIHLAR